MLQQRHKTALEEDARRAALASGEENLKASSMARLGMRPHASVTHALKGAEQLKLTVESLCHVGEALLDAGCAEGAREAFGKAKEASDAKDMRAACGEIAALLALGSKPADVSAACEGARKLYTAPAKQRASLALLQGLAGSPDEAYETALQVLVGLKPGDLAFAEATLLACEMELRMYAEAAWPRLAAARPVRKQEAALPQGGVVATWRLSRAAEKAQMLWKKDPRCVRAAAFCAELKLEALLFSELLAPEVAPAPEPAGASQQQGASEGAPLGASDSAAADEVAAIMRLAGVAASRSENPAAALRAIEQKRRKVLEEGGSGAQAEADELAKLHEWQMRKLSEQRHHSAAAARPAAQSSLAPPNAPLVEALELCDAALRSVDDARHSPSLALLRGRLLLRLEQPADAVGPLAAAEPFVDAAASWRASVCAFREKQLGSSCAATTGGGERAHAAVLLYLGLAQALTSRPYEEYVGKLAAALSCVEEALASLPRADAPGAEAGEEVPLEWMAQPLTRAALSPLNPDLAEACRLLAVGQVEAGDPEAACRTCELGDRCAALLVRACECERTQPSTKLACEVVRLHLQWVRCLTICGREAEAAARCEQAAMSLWKGRALARLMSNGGLMVDPECKVAIMLLVQLAQAWVRLQPHRSAAHTLLAEARLKLYDTDPTKDAQSDDTAKQLLLDVKAGLEKAMLLEGTPQGVVVSSRAAFELQQEKARAHEKPPTEEAKGKEPSASPIAATSEKVQKKPATSSAATANAKEATKGGKIRTAPPPVNASKNSKEKPAGSGAAAAKSLAAPKGSDAGKPPGTRTTPKPGGPAARSGGGTSKPAPPKESAPKTVAAPPAANTVVASTSAPSAVAPAAAPDLGRAPGAAPPSCTTPPADSSPDTASATPIVDAVVASNSNTGCTTSKSDMKGLAQFVEATLDARAAEEPKDGPVNGKSIAVRLSLVQVCRELGEDRAPLRPILEEILNSEESARRDISLYEELGEILKKDDPKAAIDVYCSFPFSGSSDFGENALRLAAVKLLLSQEMFEDVRLKDSLIAIGKCFGGPKHVEKEVDILDRKGLTDLCKEIYLGISGLTEAESRGFFATKGWAEGYTSAEYVAQLPSAATRKKMPPRQPRQ